MNEIKIGFCIFCAVITVFFSYDLHAFDNQLNITVDRYLYSLKYGDIETLAELMSDEEFSRNEKRLKNLNYSSFLKRYYENCDFIIEDIKELTSSKFEYKVKIISNDQILAMPIFTFQKINGEWKMIGTKQEF